MSFEDPSRGLPILVSRRQHLTTELTQLNNRTTSLRLGLASGLLFTFAALASFAAPASGQSLGAAASFGVLGASTVTNTGATIVQGNVGVSPGTAIDGFPPGVTINGGIHAGDGLATQAHADFATAYNYYAGLPSPPANDLTGQDFGGKTLTPGVYHCDVAATSNGALTFDAQGNPDAIFVIKIGTTFITSGDSTVNLINGADARNIYFQLGTAATLGGGSTFKGNLLAGTAITAVGGVNVTGRLLALVEAVTLDTNTVHVAPVVRNTNDDGVDSLRQAIVLAKEGDTITFEIPTTDPRYTGSEWLVTLTSGELLVDKAIRIAGLGANVLTVMRDSAAQPFRIFHVTAPQVANSVVALDGMTILNGSAQSVLEASGGGLYNDHTNVTVNACTFRDNSAGSSSSAGGAIYNDATNGSASLQVSNSSFIGNSAPNGFGGAIANNGEQGSPQVTIVNSTFSGNSANEFGGAAIDNNTGSSLPLRVLSCTVADNSGGASILSFGPLQIGNTILKAGLTPNNLDGEIESLGYNLSDDFGNGLLTGTGDQVDTDPILGPLKDNGGPTLTYAPLSNSPTLDMGQDVAQAGFGQRGGFRPTTYDTTKVRPAGGDGSDVGAVELAVGVQPISAVSRKSHGSLAGSFDLNLPIFGAPGIECRSGGVTGNYEIVLTFAQPIVFNGAAVTSGTGTIVGTGTNRIVRSSKTKRGAEGVPGTTQVTLELADVLNLQTITLALFNVSDGSHGGDVGIRAGILVGDTTRNGVVNASDIGETKTQSGANASPANFRNDVTANGVINGSDIGLVKSQAGSTLPGPASVVVVSKEK